MTEAALAPTGLHVRAVVSNLFFSQTHRKRVQSGEPDWAARYFESGENAMELVFGYQHENLGLLEKCKLRKLPKLNSPEVKSTPWRTLRFFAPS